MDGGCFALRVFRADQAAMARREVAAMTAAAAAGLAVPSVRASGTWHERSALLVTWMPGRPVRQEVCRHPWRARALGIAFGRTQAAMHRVPPPGALRDRAASWVEWAKPGEALRACLLARPCAREALLHLDYHPLNVLTAQGQISAVLDWANARPGDPRADLARTLSILLFTPFCDTLPTLAARVARQAFMAGWRRGYREDAGPMAGMAPFYAWAGEVMIHDLSPRVGRPDFPWLTPALLEDVRRWATGWRLRAGCPG